MFPVPDTPLVYTPRINCAAGHHMAEAGWLTNSSVRDSITRWWVQPEALHKPGYYYWYASALRRNYDKNGDKALLRQVVPAYVQKFPRMVYIQQQGESPVFLLQNTNNTRRRVGILGGSPRVYY